MADSATLTSYGIDKPSVLHHNLSYEAIAEHEQRRKEGQFVKTQNKEGETCAVDTGKFTGRSPKDKFIVRQAPSQDHIWWGSINQPTTPEVFEELRGNVVDYLNGKDELYVFDGYVGASEVSRRHVRFVSEFAWQHHFVTNMFRRPDAAEAAELSKKEPDFTVLNASNLTNPKWKEHGLHSEVFVVFNIEHKLGIIGGTWYGGEMKKGIFSMMNFWLPLDGTLSMHCSCNVGEAGDTALFFGLSGTGKTTLSADPKRKLIGDDEHGWDDHGVFNLEGGCYAKTIGLDAEAEPEIYNAIRRDALLENIAVSADGSPDYNDSSKTENGRVSYPLHFISNHEPSSTGGHPTNIIFLTCDAYGVLPPVSKLTPEQAMYHFLSGYTAKVAGTERGITEPQATFSACFGAAFMTQHPTVYAKLLGEKMRAHSAHAYLVNTGWSGGAYGVGSRMKIRTTRACIDAIMDGSIRDAEFVEHPTFKVAMPTALPKIDPVVLQPRNTWADKDAYDAMCKKLATEFIENYKQFQADGFTDFSAHGPQA